MNRWIKIVSIILVINLLYSNVAWAGENTVQILRQDVGTFLTKLFSEHAPAEIEAAYGVGGAQEDSGHTLDGSSGFKIIGDPLGEEFYRVMKDKENEKDGWREQAKGVPIELFDFHPDSRSSPDPDVKRHKRKERLKNINFAFPMRIKGFRIKMIQDKDLPEEVESWSFWEDETTKDVRVIVTRRIPNLEVQDEIKFHEAIESRWIDYLKGEIGKFGELTLKEETEILRRAHIYAWVVQGFVFGDDEEYGITPIQKKQLDAMVRKPHKLQSLLNEHQRMRQYHRVEIRKLPGREAERLARENEDHVKRYIIQLLSEENSRRLFEGLSLSGRNSSVWVLLEELGAELDTRNIDKVEDAIGSGVPITLKNHYLLENLFDDRLSISELHTVFGKIVMSDNGPVAIRFKYNRVNFLIDISKLTAHEYESVHEEDITDLLRLSVNALKTSAKADFDPFDEEISFELVNIDKWGIDSIIKIKGDPSPDHGGAKVLIDAAIKCVKQKSAGRDSSSVSVLDLGSMTGNIGLAVANETVAQVTCSDYREKAVLNTKLSAAVTGLTKNIKIVKTNLFNALTGRRFDVITYDPSYDMAGLMIMIEPQSFFPNLFYQFGDYLTSDGVLLLRVPDSAKGIVDIMKTFSKKGIIRYRKMSSHDKEKSTIYKIWPNPKRKSYPVTGPLRILGPRIDQDTLQNLRVREKRLVGWRHQAGKLKSEQYPIKNIEIPECEDPVSIHSPSQWNQEGLTEDDMRPLKLRIMTVLDLPPNVYAAYLWFKEGEDEGLAIIMRETFEEQLKEYEDKSTYETMLNQLKDEVIFYGYMHRWWSERMIAGRDIKNLTDEEREEIRYKAHILASSQRALVFKGTKKVQTTDRFYGGYHSTEIDAISVMAKLQLDNMTLEQLKKVIHEFGILSEDSKAIRTGHIGASFAREITAMELLIKNYAINRSLLILSEDGSGVVRTKRNSGNVKECYIDMHGTLDVLEEAWEKRRFFQALKEMYGEDLQINIFTKAGDIDDLIIKFEERGIIKFITRILITDEDKFGIGKKRSIKHEYNGGFVWVDRFGVPNKAGCIANMIRQKNESGEMDEDDRILYFDDDGDMFGSNKQLIQVGIISERGKVSVNYTGDEVIRNLFDDLGRPKSEPPPDFYITSLKDLDALFEIAESIKPVEPDAVLAEDPVDDALLDASV